MQKIEHLASKDRSDFEGMIILPEIPQGRKLNGLLVSELVSRLYPNKINKQTEQNQPRAKLKQYDAKMICYVGCDAGCICKM